MQPLTAIDKRILVTASYNEVAGELALNADYQQLISGDAAERSAAEEWVRQAADARTDSILASFARIDLNLEQATAALQQAFPGAEVQHSGPQPHPSMQPAQQFYAPQAPAPMPQQMPQPGNVVPFTPPMQAPPQQYQQQAPQQQYGGGGGNNSADADWQDLLMNPGNWRDERFSKRNPNGPDFVHAFRKKQNGKDVGLWLHGRFGQPPQHILQQLQMQGRA